MAEQVHQLVQNNHAAQAIFAHFTAGEASKEIAREVNTIESNNAELGTELSTELSTATLVAELNQAVVDRQNQQLTLKQAIQLAQRFDVLAKEQQTLSLQQENDKQQLNSTDEELRQLRQRYSVLNQQKKDVETLLSQQQTIMALSEHRAKLQPEEACPLCGSVEHPAINDYQALDSDEHQDRLLRLNDELAILEKQGKQLNQVQAQFAAQLTAQQNRQQGIMNEQNAIEQNWLSLDVNQQLNQSVNKGVTHNQDEQQFSLQNSNAEQDLTKQLNATLQQLEELVFLQQQLQENSQIQQQNAEKIIHCEKQLSAQHNQLLLVQEQNNAQHNVKEKIVTDIALAQQTMSILNAQLLADVSVSQITLPKSENDEQYQTICIDENWLSHVIKQGQEYQAIVNTHQAAQEHLSSIENNLALLKQQVDQQQSQYNQTKLQLSQQENDLAINNASRITLFIELGFDDVSMQNPVFLREEIEKQREDNQESLNFADNQHNEKLSAQQLNKGQLTTAKSQLDSLSIQNDSVKTDWDKLLSTSSFIDEETFLLALISPDKALQLQKLASDIRDNKKQAQVLIAQSEKVALELADKKTELSESGAVDFDEESVSNTLMNLSELLKQCQQKTGQYSQQINHDKTNKAQQQSLLEQIKQAQLSLDDLSHLNALVGSADGAKFRRFAQGLTLSNLVHLANAQLERLFGRYQLQCQQSDNLALEVVDTWQGDTARDIKTLSGGESFLISLALALALSDLVSNKTSIDSLFLDEGFGTLDNNTLEVALDALDNLNASGKMIGVISHVDALKERIGVQIKVKKLSGLGVSSLDKQYEFHAEAINEPEKVV